VRNEDKKMVPLEASENAAPELYVRLNFKKLPNIFTGEVDK
jgi:hypothetical protein